MEYMEIGCTNADSWGLAQVAISVSLRASQKIFILTSSLLESHSPELLFPQNLLSIDGSHVRVLVKSVDYRANLTEISVPWPWNGVYGRGVLISAFVALRIGQVWETECIRVNWVREMLQVIGQPY